MTTKVALFSIAVLLGVGLAERAAAGPLLRNPALINIGFVCEWQARCMDRQQHAMTCAIDYVNRKRPPVWRVQQCNRNAARVRDRRDWRRGRVDWVGFNNCIRNSKLRPVNRA